MSRVRRLWIIAACALPLSQLGHALAAFIRYGAIVPPGSRHAYFGAELEVSAAALGAGLLAALLVVGAARRLGGRPLRGRAWPLGWLLLGLAALQLELYLVQEVAEGSTSIDVAVRGLVGQLPVALVASLALHWLSIRLGPAVRRLRRRVPVALVRLAPRPEARLPELLPVTPPARRADRRLSRAPPSILLIPQT